MSMDPRLQAWLDGDVGFDDLPEALRAEAAGWTSVLDGVRALDAPGASPAATDRVMEAIRAEAVSRSGIPDHLRAGWRWLTSPRPIRMPPLAAAAVLAFAVWAGVRLLAGGASVGPEVGPSGGMGTVYVQFVIAAPEASSVALAGDFNEWTPTIELVDPDLDGVWTGRVALEAGVHEYMFVIDGTEWRPDPNALSYTDDGFGRRNSVVAVAPLEGT